MFDDQGQQVTVTMGSYGIGVSRCVAAIAEAHHDEHGLCWPDEIAPADVHIVIAGKSEEHTKAAEAAAEELEAAGLRVFLDDREDISAGVKFNDADLIGVPKIVVFGRDLADGFVEVKDRRTGDRDKVAVASLLNTLSRR